MDAPFKGDGYMATKDATIMDCPVAGPPRLREMRVKISTALIDRSRRYGNLKIPSDELIIVGGAAMQMYGIKMTEDIDVVVTPQQMQRVLKEIDPYQHNTERCGLLLCATDERSGQFLHGDEYGSTYGNITYMMAPSDHLYQATFEELHDEAKAAGRINGFLVSPPERILAWKQDVNRPKDKADIKLIKRYLARK